MALVKIRKDKSPGFETQYPTPISMIRNLEGVFYLPGLNAVLYNLYFFIVTKSLTPVGYP